MDKMKRFLLCILSPIHSTEIHYTKKVCVWPSFLFCIFDLPPKNWSRYNVRVRIRKGGFGWSGEATDLMRSSID